MLIFAIFVPSFHRCAVRTFFWSLDAAISRKDPGSLSDAPRFP